MTDHGSFVLINVYVPNAGDASAGQDRPRVAFKLRFLRALRELSSSLRRQGREVLLVGDFNVAEDADWHPRLKPPYTTEEIEALRSFTESEEALVDVWRKLHPEAKGVYTVWDEKTSARAFNEGLRIDYIFASPGLMQHVVSCEVVGTDVLPPKWSDHAGIVVELGGELSSPPEKRAPCAAWTQLLRRFHDPAQRSIKDMFGRKPKTEKQGGAEGERVGEKHPAEVPGGSDGDGASVEAPMLKKSRREDSETHARVKK